jgi:hypothetical protein
MIRAEYPGVQKIFFTCGENRKEIQDALGASSQHIYIDDLEYEQNAALNWYICSKGGLGFVGLSRSTFSNLICLRRELDRMPGGCWIYNYGDKLSRRVDAGLQPCAENALKKVTNII